VLDFFGGRKQQSQIEIQQVIDMQIPPSIHQFSCRPKSFHSARVSVRSAPPALVVRGLAGVLMVPRGCMGIQRSGGAKWMLCWLLPAAVKIYYSLNIALKGRKGVNPGILRRQLLLFS